MTITVLVSVIGHMVELVLITDFFPSVSPLQSASTSAGHGLLPGQVTTFVPKGSGPLVILPDWVFVIFCWS